VEKRDMLMLLPKICVIDLILIYLSVSITEASHTVVKL
jgi:hypothetical protein